MSVSLYGKKTIRQSRDKVSEQLMEIAGDPKNTRVNEVAMNNLIHQLFNHIEDLEQFICNNAGIDYLDSVEVGDNDVHFDEDMFKVR